MSEITFVGANFEAPISSIRMYSDSTTMVKTDAFAEICEKADTMILRPSNLSGFVAGLSIIDSIIAVNGENTIKKLILPYIPGARQDRVNPTGDVGFMLSTVGRIINSYGFESVVAVDPHSEASNAHISNLDVYPYEALYSHLWTGYSGVIAPDKGARDRAAQAFHALGMDHRTRDLVQAEKVRDVSTGRLSGFDVTVTPGAHYIVIDDICDGGGTFVGLGEKIREQGAFADLFVTHGIFSKGTTELHKLYKNIYTTNTRDTRDHTGVIVFDIMKELKAWV